MRIIMATKTLAAIEEALIQDQGAAYRGQLKNVLPHIDDAYRDKQEGPRSHLGASLLGGTCEREIWLGWRWATIPSFEGRMLRLFNRGHLEEGRFIALLLMIGVVVYQQDADGKQYRISGANGHYGGSGDGFALNVPDLPAGAAALTEFKTHSPKSFAKFYTKVRDTKVPVGVHIAFPKHYKQMQQYMGKFNVPFGLYMAVDKGNDELYAEIIRYDAQVAGDLYARADRLVAATDAPPRLPMAGVSWHECRFCNHKAVCVGNATPHANCRTCAYSKPADNGEWHCNHPSVPPKILDKQAQLHGCKMWKRFNDN